MRNANEAVHNAVVLEEVAKMAARCEMINPQNNPVCFCKIRPQCDQQKASTKKRR